MKLKLAAAALCAAGIAMPAAAGDAEDAKATVAKAQKAYNSCDVEAMQSLTHENFFGFNMDGTLSEGNDMAEMKAQCEAGAKYNFKLSVDKVHAGDGWAVLAGQNTGSITPPEGETQQIDSHFTVVMVKNGDKWQSLHLHASPNIKSEE
ncbi:MAG: YybH family protein [Alphaproteobacteria bacterium]